jgi:hypothetical protein
VLQAGDYARRLVEQIRDQHDQAARRHRVGKLRQRPPGICPGAGHNLVERVQDGAQVSRPDARRHQAPDLLVEGHQPRGIALPLHQVRDRRGERAGVLQLGQATGPVGHRAADVEQQIPLEIRLLLVLADDEAIRSREDFPVDGGEVVTRQVLPVLRELDGESLQRTAVQPREKSFDDGPRAQLQCRQPRDD